MIMSADIQNGFVMALNGDGIYIEEKEGTGRVVLNSESTVTTVDQVGSNGVIHIIDTGKSTGSPLLFLESDIILTYSFFNHTVLLPPVQTIFELAQSNGFETLVAALVTAGLDTVLDGEDPYTVFAPTDAAFAALGQATIDALLGDVPMLTKVLLYHVTNGYLGSGELPGIGTIETLAEADIEVSENGKRLNGNVLFETTDIIATNGVVHVIDAVLIPPALDGPGR